MWREKDESKVSKGVKGAKAEEASSDKKDKSGNKADAGKDAAESNGTADGPDSTDK